MLQQRQKVLAKAPSTHDPKQTSDNAVAFFSFWSPSELSRI